jgi:hypothetical protein
VKITYELAYRVKPLSRDEEFTTPYVSLGYHEDVNDAADAAKELKRDAPGLEIRICECRI